MAAAPITTLSRCGSGTDEQRVIPLMVKQAISKKHLMGFALCMVFATAVSMFFWNTPEWLIAPLSFYIILAAGLNHSWTVTRGDVVEAFSLWWFCVRKSADFIRNKIHELTAEPGSTASPAVSTPSAPAATPNAAAEPMPDAPPANLPPGVDTATSHPTTPQGSQSSLPLAPENQPSPTHLPPGVEATPAANNPPANLPPGVENTSAPNAATGPGVTGGEAPSGQAPYNAEPFATTPAASTAFGTSAHPSASAESTDDMWRRRLPQLFPSRQHILTTAVSTMAPVLFLTGISTVDALSYSTDKDICSSGRALILEANKDTRFSFGDNDEYYRLFDKYVSQLGSYRGDHAQDFKSGHKRLKAVDESSTTGAYRVMSWTDISSDVHYMTNLACTAK